MRVRGEAFGLFSLSYAIVIPHLIHKRLIKARWGMLPEKLVVLGIVHNGLFNNIPQIKFKALDQCIQ